MSDALEVDDGQGGTQSRRVERKSRRDGPVPEDALKEVREGLGKQVTAATETANTAIKQRNDMAATALATTEARINERDQYLTSQIAAAKTSIDNAKAAKKAAREAGDGDAQDAAEDALIDAKTSLRVLEIQKQNFDGEKSAALDRAKEAAKPVAAVADNSASEAWKASRPRFDETKDPAYFAVALQGHHEAQSAGLQTNSPAYFAKIDGKLASAFGADHAKAAPGDGTSRKPREARTSETSMATPVGREAAGDGYSSQNHDLRIVVNGEGKRSISGTIPKDWVEAAKWTGMTPAAYAIAQLDIEAEGGAANGGFDPQGRVQVYR